MKDYYTSILDYYISILAYIQYSLRRKEVRIFILSTLAGGTFQILAQKYLKNHPELTEPELEPEIAIETKPKSNLTSREIHMLIYGLLTGGVIQILAQKYLKNQPKLLSENLGKKKKRKLEIHNKRLGFQDIARGGQLRKNKKVNKLVGKSAKWILRKIKRKIIKHLAVNGLATGIIIGVMPNTSKYLLEASPHQQPCLYTRFKK